MALREVYHAHTWMAFTPQTARTIGPNETAWLETELQCLAPLGLQPGTALNLALAVGNHVRGAVQPELYSGGSPRFGHLNRPETRERFPLLTSLVESPEFSAADELTDFFEYGLRQLLAGIAACHAPQAPRR